MSLAALPLAEVELGPVLSERAKALRLLASLLGSASVVGWAAVLLLQASAPSAESFRVVGASALAFALGGLLAGWCAWRSWRRDGEALRISALRLSWFHAVMSETNRLILRRPNPRELFEGVCQVCVAGGHLDLVVIDLSDVGEVHRATAEAADFPAGSRLLPLLLDGARMQMLMMTLALSSESPFIIDDATADQRLSEAREWSVATGLCSLAAVPLRRGGVPVGILLLHSKTRAFFDRGLSQLLSELGADLSFALDNSDRERERLVSLGVDRARATAEDANKAKTAFMAQMSHELRTPLNAILGFAQLLASDTVQVLLPSQAERVRLITHAGWHLLGLVNDVMDISRIESGHFEVVNVCSDISGVLDEAVALTQPLARTHRVELIERAPSRFGIGALADPRRLHQVLLNLLSNACKYNRSGGQVHVEVIHAGAEVLLDVVDNGVGMTEEHLSHLFEPFNRLGNEGHAIEGFGIGLSLTRQLVEMMNGRLEIESSTTSGTRARVVLPACAIPLEAVMSEAFSARRVPASDASAIVLYIEDDPVNQILVEQMLRRRGGVCLLQAENGSDGIALAQKERPDVILLDMHLPDMSGLDVLARLRTDTRTESLRVVAVSANAVPVDVAKAMEMGALDYWTKPLKLDAFLAGISALLQDRVAAANSDVHEAANAQAPAASPSVEDQSNRATG